MERISASRGCGELDGASGGGGRERDRADKDSDGCTDNGFQCEAHRTRTRNAPVAAERHRTTNDSHHTYLTQLTRHTIHQHNQQGDE